MNDEHFQRTVGSWLRDEDPAPPDSLQSARQVAARVPLVRQQSRWWPLPLLRHAPTPARASDTTDYQPSPVPATNGHSPTVIGRTQSMLSPVKAITAGAIVFALGGAFLIAQPFEREPATDPAAATEAGLMLPAMVTGTINHHYEAGETTGVIETNDRRLNGEVASDWTLEDVPDLVLPEETDLGASKIAEYERLGAELSWGSLRITNDDGSWEGSVICTPTLLTNGSEDPCFIELSGSGSYDGLSALLVSRDRISAIGYEPRDETYVLDGLVFPGDLPPDR